MGSCALNFRAPTVTPDLTTAPTAAASRTSSLTDKFLYTLPTTSRPGCPHATVRLSRPTPSYPLAAQFSCGMPLTTTYLDKWSSTHQSTTSAAPTATTIFALRRFNTTESATVLPTPVTVHRI